MKTIKTGLLRIAALLFSGLITFGVCAACTEKGRGSESSAGGSEISSDSGETEISYAESKTSTPPSEVNYEGYTTYYFDGTNGNDSKSGKSELAPKRSLSEMAEIAAKATAERPIRILLKRGSTFEGKLLLGGYEATAEQPLVLDAYGDGADPLPKLTGTNTDTDTRYAVVRLTEGNTRIYNLEITDPYAYQGIYVKPTESGAKENIVVANCYVHDVNFFWKDSLSESDPPEDYETLDAICPEYASNGSYGRYYYRNNGGIIFDNDTPASIGPSWFENVYVLNNRVEKVARTGIYMATKWSNAPGVGYGYNLYVEESDKYNNVDTGVGYFMHKNVNFVGNELDVIGGDGIILAGKDSFLEYNVCYHANYLGRIGKPNMQGVTTTYYNAAIWVFNSENVYFQYNEAGYTLMRNGGQDAEGFDIDNASRNVYFQYNYAHHNEGGGILVCNNTASLLRYDAEGNCISPDGQPERLVGNWGNNYIRNNVFAYNGNPNDARRAAFLTVARQADGLYAYNNTVILGEIPGQRIVNVEDQETVKNHYYANNIFYSAREMEREASASVSLIRGLIAENNLYVNVGEGARTSFGETAAAESFDPLFTLPTEYNGFDKIAYFKPANALAFTSGKEIDGSLAFDLAGKDAKGCKYLGAYAG